MLRVRVGIVGAVALLLTVLVGPASAQEVQPETGATAEAGTVSVTPTTGLVDDQIVAVNGSGFARHTFVEVLQCRRNVGSYLGCADYFDASYADIGRSGRFSIPLPVQAVLDTEKGPIDCRLAAGRCELRIRGFGRHRVGFRVPLTFVPESPLAAPPTLSASPAADLADGQIVTATGDGFHPDAHVEIYQCPTGAGSASVCGDEGFGAQADGEGTFAIPFSVEAVLDNAVLSTDCRSSACELVAIEGEGYEGFDDPGRATIALDPAGALRPPPTLTVTPHTDLHGGQTVEVHGGGFRPLGSLLLLECRAQNPTVYGCALDQAGPLKDFRADADGDFDQTFVVHSHFELIDGRGRNCRTRPCSVTAVTLGSNLEMLPVPIAFAPH